jgi:hypothetical protein
MKKVPILNFQTFKSEKKQPNRAGIWVTLTGLLFYIAVIAAVITLS